MIIFGKQLIGLTARTQSGIVLGRVKDFEVSAETGEIVRYVISSSQIIKKILTPDLIINKNQVIEITGQALIVEDALAGAGSVAEEPMSV